MSTRLSRFNAQLLCLGIVLALVLTTSSVFAQSTISGEVTGVVTDASGAVVPNATVTLDNKEMGTTQAVATNATGGFRFTLLRPGVYTVTVKATGFSGAA